MIVAITGGSRGIGRAIADLFRKNGHSVAICSRKAQALKSTARFMAFQADVRRRGDIKKFADAVNKRWGRLDVFINCAGISLWEPLQAIDENFARDMIETNVLGTLWGCQAAVRIMAKGGAIVNISSLAGKRGSSNNSVYCASKFAVNGITQSLAKELGPKGIRVNAVCPVYIRTPYVLSSLKHPASPAGGRNVELYLSRFAKTQTALGRLPTSQEVAQTVYFLAGPGASGITGQCLNVDCGTLPQ